MLNINIKRRYSTDDDKIIEDFYLPVLSCTKVYKRAVGYFTSPILVEYIKSLKDLYFNDGKMKLIISPQLNDEDLFAMQNYQSLENTSNVLSELEYNLMNFLNNQNQEVKEASELLFLLMANQLLEVKIAVPKYTNGIFHEKIGIFELVDNNVIAINGSNNETYSSVNLNHESFSTFCSWKIGQSDYVQDHLETFDTYWNNMSKSLNVMDLDESFVKGVLKKIDLGRSISDRFSKLTQIGKITQQSEKLKFTPFPYQKNAAELLLEKKKGILEFATGSGKTKLSIYFMEELKKTKSKTFFIIVVPDKTLMEQWYQELSEYNDNLLKCYSENPGWYSEFRKMIDIYKQPVPTNQVVLVTNQTMFRQGNNSRFLRQLKKLDDDFILVVDELHNWSTANIVSNLPKSEYSIGLSATPFNYPMSQEDKRLEEYFNGIIASYSLGDAIKDKRLVPYNYHPIFITLNEDELDSYTKITRDIIKAKGAYEKYKDAHLLKTIELLSFKRSRIVYGAMNKIVVLKEKMMDGTIPLEKLLIYCGATNYSNEVLNENGHDTSVDDDAIGQLKLVNNMLMTMGITGAQYTQKESTNDRENHIDLFEKGTISTLVAIKCLDEGVDIPSISNAVILASSSNRREFIQRRGRVLRRDGIKEFANIFDFVVFDEYESNSHLNKLERTRVKEFNSLALNRDTNRDTFNNYLEGDIYGEE